MAIIKGNDDNNVLVGTAYADTILGYDGEDVLIGGGGNDILNGGAGADTMDGGKGGDTYVVDDNDDQVIEYANNGDDTVRASTSFGLTNAPNVENLILTGSADIRGYGSTLDNDIYGNSGNNELYGFEGTDYLNGGGGDDTLDGDSGGDTMAGGKGNDTFIVDSPGDTVIENANQGTDEVRSSVDYTLAANVEHLVLTGAAISGTGNALHNAIAGNAESNHLDGGAGGDTMYGRDGDDVYYVDNVADVPVENANSGHDVVYSTVDETLGYEIEVLSLDVGTAIFGTGNYLNNTIFGNAANNVLDGGDGGDSLSGLGGNDTFVFNAGEALGDTVYEFAGNGAGAGDVLQFSGYGTLAQGATFTQLTATEWQVTSADGLTQETITLVGAPTIDASDVVFV